jgi:tungstate transport system substrate-binding protein
MFKKWGILFLVLVIVAGIVMGCNSSTAPAPQDPAPKKELILGTTTSTYDSGLLDYLLPYFEEASNYEVKVVSLGTGAALELGKNGDCDLILVHARQAELDMVEQGHYVDRYDVMYNDFVVVGPAADPASVKDAADLNNVLAAISNAQSPFISRGDDSGTHKKELTVWSAAGIEPSGSWYVAAGSGMADTLRMADEKVGYTLTDRATYLSLRDTLDLDILFEGDVDLFNQYGIMAVNQLNWPQRDYVGAKLLTEFFISAEGQELIANFKPYGDTLFFPNAE